MEKYFFNSFKRSPLRYEKHLRYEKAHFSKLGFLLKEEICSLPLFPLRAVHYGTEKHFFLFVKRSPLRYEKTLVLQCVISLNVYNFQYSCVHNRSYAYEIIKY